MTFELQDPTINSAEHWQRVMQGHAAANVSIHVLIHVLFCEDIVSIVINIFLTMTCELLLFFINTILTWISDGPRCRK